MTQPAGARCARCLASHVGLYTSSNVLHGRSACARSLLSDQVSQSQAVLSWPATRSRESLRSSLHRTIPFHTACGAIFILASLGSVLAAGVGESPNRRFPQSAEFVPTRISTSCLWACLAAGMAVGRISSRSLPTVGFLMALQSVRPPSPPPQPSIALLVRRLHQPARETNLICLNLICSAGAAAPC